MKIDDVLIIKYVDGLLDESEVVQFEAKLEMDESLREQVAALRASQLPYKAAFDQQELPPIPEALSKSIGELSHVISEMDTSRAESQPQTFRKFLYAASIAFAFVAGIASTKMALVADTDSDINADVSVLSQNLEDIDLESLGGKDLIDATIIYQALYDRDTVGKVFQSEEDKSVVLERFNQGSDRALQVPQIDGYEFRRVQTLNHQGKAIAQMVYLGDEGYPLALCVTPISGEDQKEIHYPLAKMNTLVWAQGKLSYMLIGKLELEELKEIREKLII